MSGVVSSGPFSVPLSCFTGFIALTVAQNFIVSQVVYSLYPTLEGKLPESRGHVCLRITLPSLKNLEQLLVYHRNSVISFFFCTMNKNIPSQLGFQWVKDPLEENRAEQDWAEPRWWWAAGPSSALELCITQLVCSASLFPLSASFFLGTLYYLVN